ncbi:hypothetical protein N7492_009162 [Penicillium capsulatum]|uniref:Uncharacterized protein n=1 Tax=Penicillium capsulatum TaxID=69766 RepID=A0A9W9LHH8_9EURO|nr:hypothetical protein N7492_009162 [Penicillium capsulatum]KAJ6106561.1 hypothetical protein N7512_010078 [Penicillium capsulatum]
MEWAKGFGNSSRSFALAVSKSALKTRNKCSFVLYSRTFGTSAAHPSTWFLMHGMQYKNVLVCGTSALSEFEYPEHTKRRRAQFPHSPGRSSHLTYEAPRQTCWINHPVPEHGLVLCGHGMSGILG